jgi:hypothetical protein
MKEEMSYEMLFWKSKQSVSYSRYLEPTQTGKYIEILCFL